MIQLDSNISFFYFEYTFEPSSRIDYFFVINEEWQLDPWNHNQSPYDSETNSSELSMPLFEQPTEIIYRESISHGIIKKMASPWINPEVNVYIPPIIITRLVIQLSTQVMDFITLTGCLW